MTFCAFCLRPILVTDEVLVIEFADERGTAPCHAVCADHEQRPVYGVGSPEPLEEAE